MAKAKKDKIRALLKSIETGDPRPVAVVNEAKYIQHNPQTHEGSEPKLTESNRALVHSFVEAVLVGGQLDRPVVEIFS